jgi:hypothetical protein
MCTDLPYYYPLVLISGKLQVKNLTSPLPFQLLIMILIIITIMRTITKILLPCLVTSVIVLMCWQLLPQQLQTTIEAQTQSQGQEQQPEMQHEPECRFWVAYGSGPGVKVSGYPSKGGVYVLRNCFGVELDFLGLDRFNDTERPSKLDPDWKAKVDAHCDRSQLPFSFSLTFFFLFIACLISKSASPRRYLVAKRIR